MQVMTGIRELRAAVAAEKRRLRAERPEREPTVGFMPTLGYMHEGHLSLIAQARRENDLVVVSIFVNPMQFGANEDFDKYPRDNERDTRLAEGAGADFVFLPSVNEMYPQYPAKSKVVVTEITDVLCGASRPGHFDGVATVVTKLFNIVQPDRAYFGQKDAQQVAVIEQMVQDLNMPLTIVPCPTLREPDGLAMSSRNVYLSEEERRQALVLSQALRIAESAAAEGPISSEELRGRLAEHILTAPLAVIDYVDIRTYPGLQSVDSISADQPILVALAVKFGKTRLIDNTILNRR